MSGSDPSSTAADLSMSMRDIDRLLRRCTFLDRLTPEERRLFQKNGRIRHREKGGCFFLEGEPAMTFYILLSGEVKLTQTTADGQQVIIHYIRPGDGFGIIVVLSETEYPVTAVAVEDCIAMSWNRDGVKALMRACPQLAINAVALIAARFVGLQERLRELATERVEQRIAHTVLRLARQFGKRVAAGVLIDMPLSHQDIAEMSGTTIYTVSRTLRHWERAGVVENSRQQLLIYQPHQLVTISEGNP